jgi:NAD(P)-dependent dehydrogenase (short-subunit alcohol dehydrogenase family)
MSDKRVALITGATKGLGLEIARQLGQQGITVVLGARGDKGAAAAEKLKAEGIDAHWVKLEVTNAADVAALPGYFDKNFGRLDILVNNAGIGPDFSAPPSLALFRETYETNLFGLYAVTDVLLPLLKKSPAGRIVNHSSILGSIANAAAGHATPSPAYNSSKAALNMLTVYWSQILKDTKIKVNSAHPGWVKTDLGGAGAMLEIPDGATTAVQLAVLPDDGPTGGYFHKGKTLPW